MELKHTGIRNYYIYEDGTVLNKDNGKILKQQQNKVGYMRVELKVQKGIPKKFSIHRLVYQAFVGELIDGMVIEHLDGDKTNNHYNNLKQSTQKQNIKTALNQGTFGMNNKKTIVVKELATGTIIEFKMVKDLIEYTGISIPNGSLNKLKSRKAFKDNFQILEVRKG